MDLVDSIAGAILINYTSQRRVGNKGTAVFNFLIDTA